MRKDDAFDGVEISTGESPVWSVIWLHGLGADGHDFESIAPELVRPEWPAMRFVFPHAPVQRVTINNGLRMRAWYDILSLDASPGRREDERGLRQSYATVHALIEREIERGVQPAHILLAGFSQGGAVVLGAGLRYPQRLAGIIALSTYLPLAEALPDEAAPANAALPIFMAHGRYDPVLPDAWSRQGAAVLQRLGHRVDWRGYGMAHAVCAEEIADLGHWIAKRVGGIG